VDDYQSFTETFYLHTYEAKTSNVGERGRSDGEGPSVAVRRKRLNCLE
jgi:hypothetical protein